MNQPSLKEASTSEAELSSDMPAHATRPLGIMAPEAAAQVLAASGVGGMLRNLREARGHSIGEVSSRLKYSARQVEALEAERWDALPKGVSLRGFVRNYGRFLETDVDSLLAMLDKQVGETGPRTTVAPPAPAHAVETPLQVDTVSRPWGWLLIILILLFIAGFYALERQWIPDSWLVFDWLKALKND